MKIEYRTKSEGQYIADVIHPEQGVIYCTDEYPDPNDAVAAAQSWLNWFNNVPLGSADSIYYILAIPETWPGPPPNAHRYSGLHVKIGKAKDVRKRLRNLQTGTSSQLIVHALEPGSHELEQVRHKQFESDRRQGEWFACSPALMQHMFSIWYRNRVLPPEHQTEILMLQDRIDILKGIRGTLGPPDMINPSLNEEWHGRVFLDLVYANRRVK
jgi:hypothetical protein